MWRRLALLYWCNRQRGKAPLEIGLELVAKHGLPKVVYTAFLKRVLDRYRLHSETSLRRTLHEPHRLDQLVHRPGLWSRTFFVCPRDDTLWRTYRDRFPGHADAVVKTAEQICRHEFDLLGAAVDAWGTPIDWHRDPKSDYRWPRRFFAELEPVPSVAEKADVKLPYELSRMQHLPTLGKAYGLTGDERYALEIVAQVGHWLDENPCLVGVNWTCAMDVGIRIVNILWGMAFISASAAVTRTFKQRLLTSIWEHGQYLVRHLEYSIRADGTLGNHNHYLSNIVALVYLGVLFPEFKAAAGWRQLGVSGLLEEMQRQVHADGVDYESSLSYHRLVIELFTSAALLCRLNAIDLPAAFWRKLEQMYTVTLYVTRHDGRVPQVGDADDGRLHILSHYGDWDRMDHRYLLAVGAALFYRADMKTAANGLAEEVFWLLGEEGAAEFDAVAASPAPLTSRAFPDAGFYVMRSPLAYLLVCCNAVNRAVAGNHKHNDLLSFELCVGDTPFIVDPGAYIYTGEPAWRNRFRSTAYHNTVVIDGAEQNRFDDDQLFGMQPDAEPIVHQWHSTETYDWLEAEHTGYRRLPRPVSHRREFWFDKRAIKCRITDTLYGAGEHRAEWYYHFDHGIEVQQAQDTFVVASARGIELGIRVVADSPLTTEILDGWVSWRYGVKLQASILKLHVTFSSQVKVTFIASCV